MKAPRISDQGIDLIKHFEGLVLKAYKDVAGNVTIGVGTILYPNGKRVQMGDIITHERAFECLRHDIRMVEDALQDFCIKRKVELSQPQVDASLSLLYNVGTGLLDVKRSFGHALVTMDPIEISDAFLAYCKVRVGGVKTISKGLLRRRKSEAHLFLTGELRFFSVEKL